MNWITKFIKPKINSLFEKKTNQNESITRLITTSTRYGSNSKHQAASREMQSIRRQQQNVRSHYQSPPSLETTANVRSHYQSPPSFKTTARPKKQPNLHQSSSNCRCCPPSYPGAPQLHHPPQ